MAYELRTWRHTDRLVQKVNNAGYADSAGNASKVNNHIVNADVPSGAKFTDTTYSAITNAKIDSICV